MNMKYLSNIFLKLINSKEYSNLIKYTKLKQ